MYAKDFLNLTKYTEHFHSLPPPPPPPKKKKKKQVSNKKEIKR